MPRYIFIVSILVIFSMLAALCYLQIDRTTSNFKFINQGNDDNQNFRFEDLYIISNTNSGKITTLNTSILKLSLNDFTIAAVYIIGGLSYDLSSLHRIDYEVASEFDKILSARIKEIDNMDDKAQINHQHIRNILQSVSNEVKKVLGSMGG